MFDAAVEGELSRIAGKIEVELPALKAVVEVESGGKAFATVDGAPMPLIRWEGHYFYRHLPEGLKETAARKGLAHPKWGVVKNPASQQARYNLLNRAKAIDEAAALSSCSWGVGQVMGANWSWLGYPSVGGMVDTAVSGIGGQMDLMVRFMEKSGCLGHLRRRDFHAFARIYNGPGQVEVYGSRMRNAYRRFSGAQAPAPSPGLLRIGSRGPEVSELQEKLRRLGYHLHVDGDFGPATQKAVAAFQADQGLTADGIAGPHTWSAIEALQGVGAVG